MKDILLVYLLWKSNKNAMWLLNSMCSRGASPKTVLASNRHMLLLRVASHPLDNSSEIIIIFSIRFLFIFHWT